MEGVEGKDREGTEVAHGGPSFEYEKVCGAGYKLEVSVEPQHEGHAQGQGHHEGQGQGEGEGQGQGEGEGEGEGELPTLLRIHMWKNVSNTRTTLCNNEARTDLVPKGMGDGERRVSLVIEQYRVAPDGAKVLSTACY